MIYAAELTVWDPNTSTEVTHYFSSESLVTGASDTPAHTAFDPRIVQPALFRADIFSDGRTFGHSRVGFGELVLANPDGALDPLLTTPMDGRRIILRAGEPGTAYPSAWTTVLSGTMDAPAVEWNRLSVRLRDRLADLDHALQATRYAGNNSLPAGLEGVTDDLKDKPKPLCYGQVYNVSPPCVNTSRLIYQVHDGAVASVAVYDQGLALTAGTAYTNQTDMETNAPSAGGYRAWLAGGYVRLGSTPAGAITADVTQGATAADRTAAQLLKAVALKAGLASGDLSSSDVTALDTATSAVCGVWLDQETTALAVMDNLAASVGAWYGFDAAGVLRMARLAAPSGTPALDLTLAEITRLELLSTASGDNSVPAYQIKLRYLRNHTVQTNDLAGAVTAARRGWLAQEWRTGVLADSAIQTAHPLARELSFDTALVNIPDVTTELTRRLALYGVRRDRLRVTAYATPAALAGMTLGGVVQITVPRFGYTAGVLFRIVGLQTDLRASRVELELWGGSP